MKSQRVLIVEDDLCTSRLITRSLERKGLSVHQSFDIGSALEQLTSLPFDLIVLDLKLPSGMSTDWMEEFRHISRCPILVFTAKNNPEIEMMSLELGADDFVVKDRGLNVILSRIDKLLQLTLKSSGLLTSKQGQLELGDECYLNMETQTVLYKERSVSLTKIETKVLSLLGVRLGSIVTKGQLASASYVQAAESRSIDISIFRLRKKVEGILKITTVRGKGYMLEPVTSSAIEN